MRSSKLHSDVESTRAGSVMRRISSAGWAAILGFAVALSGAEAAFAERSFSGVKVDTRALGDSVTSRELKSNLESRLQYYFTGQFNGGRGAPLLVVRLTSVTIQSAPPTAGGRGEGGGDSNYLEGEALVLGRGGEILLRHPLLVALSGNQNGWYLPDFEKRKADALANSYAYWLKRQLPD